MKKVILKCEGCWETWEGPERLVGQGCNGTDGVVRYVRLATQEEAEAYYQALDAEKEDLKGDNPMNATDRTAIRFPALGIGESLVVNVRAADIDRVAALAPFLTYGPTYRRGVLSSLADYSLFVGRGDDAAADLYLSYAERAAS